MTVALDTTIADSNDHDMPFRISDGVSFIGFITPDESNYPSISLCCKIECSNDTQYRSSTKVASQKYYSEIKT